MHNKRRKSYIHSVKTNLEILALTFLVFVIILFLSKIDMFSPSVPVNAKTNNVPETDARASMTPDYEGVGQKTHSFAAASRLLNATDIAQTNTLKLDSAARTLVILIPDSRMIAQNFLPLHATIVVGTKVIWVNGDKVSPHRVTLEEESEMGARIFNKTIPYQNGTEYRFVNPGKYEVSDSLNTYVSASTGTINVITSQYTLDNLSTNSTQFAVGLFAIPVEKKDHFDKYFNILGYRIEDSYRISGPEGNDVQLYAFTEKFGDYSMILNRMASILRFLPFPDLVHHPSLSQDFKGSVKADIFAEGLSHPTSMGFVDNATILVAEKDTGSIRKISNAVLQDEPVLRLNVNSTGELGLLGLSVLNKEEQEFDAGFKSWPMSTSLTYAHYNRSVFVYFTQNENTTLIKDSDKAGDNTSLRNLIYKYDWNGKSLINPKSVVDLPAPRYHDSGKLRIGPDDQLYAVIGVPAGPRSLNNDSVNSYVSLTNSSSSIVIRIDPTNGLPSKDNRLLKSHLNNPVEMGSGEGQLESDYYYAYGIRNSFGLAFDPLTGRLWDTENGEDEYDEINIVNPGFNSGWPKIMGPKFRYGNISNSDFGSFKEEDTYYSDPIFSWKEAIGVTDIEFFDSSKLGNEYRNNLFVGDINNGNLYIFKVNDKRTGINFMNIPGIAKDLVADNKEEVDAITMGTGFGGITDIETGPDGYLYILTFHDGRLYRLTTNN